LRSTVRRLALILLIETTFLAGPWCLADSRYGVVHGDRLDFVVRGGFGWTRMDFVWNAVEPENGTFNFEELDRYVDNCSKSGVKVLAILDYSAEWASSGPENWIGRDRFPPKYLSDWEEYVYETVKHFRGKVDAFEVWNEPNIRYFWFPQADPRAYSKLLRSAYLAAKRANPNCTVVIGGTIGFDIDYLRQVYTQGGGRYFDVMAVHPYPAQPFDLCNFSAGMGSLRELMSQYGDSKKEIWITEIGWSTSQNVSKEDQAAYLVRSYVVALAEGVSKFFWFNLNAEPPPKGSSGLIEHDLTPRPAFWAHRALVDLVGQGEYEGAINPKPGVEAHLFRRPDGHVLVLWDPNQTLDVRLRMASRRSKPQVFNMVGEAMNVPLKNGALLLKASPQPIFISHLTDKDVKALSCPFSWASLAAVLGVLLATLGLYVAVRKGKGPAGRPQGKKPRRSRPKSDVPPNCEKVFKKSICLKCKHYVIQGGKGYCREFGLELD